MDKMNLQFLNNLIKNPSGLYEEMLRTNPKFAQFVNANKGKSPEQIARENGINPDFLKFFK